MLRRLAAALLTLALLAVGAPYALAAQSFSARTPLAGVGGDKRENIALAVEAIDGVRVPTGGRFSFNETVGPRVKRRGYRTAPNGRGVPVTGGGVAQAASTLYLALLQVGDDVAIAPVRTYGSRFVDDYVEDGDAAIVTDYNAGIDLSFTNLGEDMTIEMWLDDENVYCTLTLGDEGDFFILSSSNEADEDDEESLPFLPGNAERTLLGAACLDCGDSDDVLHNVRLAADCVNDTTLNRGDVFSFNDVVGPRTRKYGYRQAVNGRGAVVTGGGVAQVASALWLAVKDMEDIAIVEKATYGERYSQDYVDSSQDAILTDYASGRDFSFRYTGPGCVTIYTYISDGWLYCDIYEG